MKGDDPEIDTAQTPKRPLEKIRKTMTDSILNIFSSENTSFNNNLSTDLIDAFKYALLAVVAPALKNPKEVGRGV